MEEKTIWEVRIKISLNDENDKFGIEDMIIDALRENDIGFLMIYWDQLS